jgi:hypothetical protein
VECPQGQPLEWWEYEPVTGQQWFRVQYVGREANRLELEFKCVCWNLKRLATLSAA